ncbi:MAG: MopE-related protein [Myxococcota bacterium]|nr:MopE-related protein [Myxococcota bacterium]
MRCSSLVVLLAGAQLLSACSLFDSGPADIDQDGWNEDEDCNDLDPSVHPEAGELCDGVDNDCDGNVDEGYDEDGDGWNSCGDPGDCDDLDAGSYPGAVEECEGVDNDCDGEVDEGCPEDADGDGYIEGEDCDDSNPLVYPGAPEECDGLDNDCDILVDEDFDEDGDGWTGCLDVDCNDGNASIHPEAVEVCDGVDQNCDNVVDETFDQDNDGWTTCHEPPDCNDGNAAIHPLAPEQCDGADNDCDGEVDEDTVDDNDGDGVSACEGDCDDGNAAVFPGAIEVPNGLDDDCSGGIDDGYSGSMTAGLFGPVATGVSVQETLGDVLSAGGHFNSDPFSDFVVGTPIAGGGAGEVSLFLGSAYSAVSPPASISPFASVLGTAGDALGSSVALVDINGDNYEDIIIGSPGSNLSPDPPAGSVYVFFGGPVFSSGNWPVAAADITFTGVTPGTERCGTVVAGLGDVNGDNIEDLGFTCPWHDVGGGNVVGRTAIFFGRSNWNAGYTVEAADVQILGSLDDLYSGQALFGGVDMNGDGYDEVVVGSPNWDQGTGRIGIALGRSTASWPETMVLGYLDRVYYANTTQPQGLGDFISGGDADGDAWEDIIVGASAFQADRGAIGLLQGAPTLPLSGYFWGETSFFVTGDSSTEEAGRDGALVDIDGDGSVELAMTTPGYDGSGGGDQGRLVVFNGPLSSLAGVYVASDADAQIVGEAGGDYFGGSLTVLEDFNGDGNPDLAVGAPYYGATDLGRVYVVPAF